MTVIAMSDYQAPDVLPSALTEKPTWLVWRLVHLPGQTKPRKVPHYPLSGKPREGAQGSPEDREGLTSYDRAVAAVVKGRWSGVGIAMLRENGLVAVDFDDCVRDGQVDPRVADLCEGTYSEISPSGNGVRAFFVGTVPDRKDLKSDLKVEFFCGAGYVTVTGNITSDCAMWGWENTVAPLSDKILDLYRSRFGQPAASSETEDDDGDWLLTLSPKAGLSIEKARVLVNAMDPDGDYDTWLKVGQVLHHEFDAGEAGLDIWKEWSRKSTGKYPGDAALDAKWAGFGRYRGSPLTGRWLLKHSHVARVEAKYEAVAEWKARISAVEASAADDKEAQLRETVCVGISRDSRLDDVDREGLAQVLRDTFQGIGLRLPINVVRKLLHPLIAPQVSVASKVPPLTEFGNTQRMLARFGDSLRYVPELAQWYVWTGTRWKAATNVEIEFYAKETINDLPKEAAQHTDQGEFFGFCMVSQQARMVKNIVTLAQSDSQIMLPAGELDKDSNLLGVANGVVDLTTGKLLVAKPTMYVTRSTGCDYDPQAQCPNFIKAIHDSMKGDQEMIQWMQVLCGYIVLGNPIEDKVVMAVGVGSNGKTTTWDNIRLALGDYAKTAQADTFMESGAGNAGGAREDLLRLRGARLVYIGEPDEGSEMREGLIKSISGGEAITARGLYSRHTVTFKPTWTAVMPTNHKPIIKGTDNGIWRRMLIIPYTQIFSETSGIKADPKFREKIAQETRGILAWMVEGARLYLSRGLGMPAKVRVAVDSYRSDMDLLAEWLDEKCEIGNSLSEKSQDLWLSWQEFARERGVLKYIQSAVALGRRMEQRFPGAKGTGGVRVRLGLRLKRGDSLADGFFD